MADTSTAGPVPERSPDARSADLTPKEAEWVDAAVLAAAEAVAHARVRYAEAFIRFKMSGATDGLAHQQATVETDAELVVLEARLRLAADGR